MQPDAIEPMFTIASWTLGKELSIGILIWGLPRLGTDLGMKQDVTPGMKYHMKSEKNKTVNTHRDSLYVAGQTSMRKGHQWL